MFYLLILVALFTATKLGLHARDTKGDTIDPLGVLGDLVGAIHKVAGAITLREQLDVSSISTINGSCLGLGETIAESVTPWRGEMSFLGVVVVPDRNIPVVLCKRELCEAERGQDQKRFMHDWKVMSKKEWQQKEKEYERGNS